MTDMSKFKVAPAFRHLDPDQGLGDGISAGFPSIRYRGKQWALSYGGSIYPFKREDDGSPLTYIDCIILGASPGVSKTYFGSEVWTEESASGPICYALDGEVPDPGVPERQATACGVCPRNEWTTRPNGSRGKECQDHKRVAVLLMPTMTKKMLGSPLLEPVHLKIPPGSLRSWKKYSDELQHAGFPAASAVTRVSFSPDRLFEMNFEMVQALTDKEAPLVLPLMGSAQTKAIMGTMPEIRQISARPPVREKVDTGLEDAFGQDDVEVAQPAPKPRGGRPRAASQVINHEPAPAPAPKKSRAPVAADPADPTEPEPTELADTQWEESDTDLDASVAKLMGDKLAKMLPK